MSRTKSGEAIVEGDGEIRRRKRVNKNKDARLAKKLKEEGNRAAELPICVGKNLGDKAEGEAAALSDGELNKLCTGIGVKAEGEGEGEVLNDDELKKLQTHRDGNAESGDEGNRLRGLLADGPKKLSNKDVEDVIRYMEVDEIVSLTLKSDEGKGSDNGDTEEEREECIHQDDPNVASSQKILDILILMLGNIEKVKEVDLWLLYKNLPRSAFAPLLLVALDSYSNRSCDGVPLSKVDRDMIPELCRVLPWKLFAHILSYKTSLPLLKSTSYPVTDNAESEEEWIPIPSSAESKETCPVADNAESEKEWIPAWESEKEWIPAWESEKEWIPVPCSAESKETYPVADNAESKEEWIPVPCSAELKETYPVADDAESDEECNPEQVREAAKGCQVCLGKGQHGGIHGCECFYRDYIPNGGIVGPDYWAVCIDCNMSDYGQVVRECVHCGCKEGRALRKPLFFRSI